MAHIILKGNTYMDIDVIACVQALYEIMTLQRKDVYVHGSKTYSASVTPELNKNISSFSEKEIEDNDELYLVDVSGTEYLENQCGYPLNQVVRIFDHHFESIEYWKERLGEKAQIEEIGATATLVAEYAKKENLYTRLTKDAKKLIASAIVSNSQNFKLSMTKERDHIIFKEIAEELNFSNNWAEEYLLSIQDKINKNVTESMKNDTKLSSSPGGETITIVQMEMWDTSIFLSKNHQEVIDFLKKQTTDVSFFMSASLSEDKTYFFAADEVSQTFLSKLLNISFIDRVSIFEGIIIRKEVLRLILK